MSKKVFDLYRNLISTKYMMGGMLTCVRVVEVHGALSYRLKTERKIEKIQVSITGRA